MKVLLCGDWHGNLGHALRCVQTAEELGCERVIQLGDFGFVWSQDNTHALQAGLEWLGHGIPIAFLPGNHENWDLLDEFERSGTPSGRGGLGGVLLRPSIEYLGRAGRFELGGRTISFIGGAYSIDQAHRTPLYSWWPQEETTDDSVDELEPGPVDIMLCHDAPANNTLNQAMTRLPFASSLSPKIAGASLDNRLRVRRAWEKLQPTLTVHGHFHYHYTHLDPIGRMIVGLNCDDRTKSVAVLDLDHPDGLFLDVRTPD